MQIRLKPEDLDFVREVHALAVRGYTQSQIAAQMMMSLSGLRSKLARFSLGFENRVDVEVIRLGSGERVRDLLDQGVIVAVEEEEPAAA